MSVPKQRRDSSIELLRIMAMFFIVAHHFVVNSGVTDAFDPSHISIKQLFLSCWGAWGKAGIVAFTCISGYFMCTSKLTLKRYLKLLLEVVFYSIAVYLVLGGFGYEQITIKEILKRFFYLQLFTGANDSFVPAFLWMYLLIPYLNVFLVHAAKQQCYACVVMLVVYFATCSFWGGFHWVFWLGSIYMIGAAIRLHPMEWMSKNKICILLLVGMICVSCLSIPIALLIAHSQGARSLCGHFFLSGGSLLSLSVGVLSFLVFRNLKIGYSGLINTIASTCFGVLLIHANSNAMRRWLWHDLLDVSSHYTLGLGGLIVFSVVVCALVFLVCSLLDYLRIIFVERPFFRIIKL